MNNKSNNIVKYWAHLCESEDMLDDNLSESNSTWNRKAKEFIDKMNRGEVVTPDDCLIFSDLVKAGEDELLDKVCSEFEKHYAEGELDESNNTGKINVKSVKNVKYKNYEGVQILMGDSAYWTIWKVEDNYFTAALSRGNIDKEKWIKAISWDKDGKYGTYKDQEVGFGLKWDSKHGLKGNPTFIKDKISQEEYEDAQGNELVNINGNSILELTKHDYWKMLHDSNDDKGAQIENNPKIQNAIDLISKLFKIDEEFSV